MIRSITCLGLVSPALGSSWFDNFFKNDAPVYQKRDLVMFPDSTVVAAKDDDTYRLGKVHGYITNEDGVEGYMIGGLKKDAKFDFKGEIKWAMRNYGPSLTDSSCRMRFAPADTVSIFHTGDQISLKEEIKMYPEPMGPAIYHGGDYIIQDVVSRHPAVYRVYPANQMLSEQNDGREVKEEEICRLEHSLLRASCKKCDVDTGINKMHVLIQDELPSVSDLSLNFLKKRKQKAAAQEAAKRQEELRMQEILAQEKLILKLKSEKEQEEYTKKVSEGNMHKVGTYANFRHPNGELRIGQIASFSNGNYQMVPCGIEVPAMDVYSAEQKYDSMQCNAPADDVLLFSMPDIVEYKGQLRRVLDANRKQKTYTLSKTFDYGSVAKNPELSVKADAFGVYESDLKMRMRMSNVCESHWCDPVRELGGERAYCYTRAFAVKNPTEL